MLCVVRGGKCLCQSADLAAYMCASFSWHFVSMLSYGYFRAMGTAVPQMNAISSICRIGWECCCQYDSASDTPGNARE